MDKLLLTIVLMMLLQGTAIAGPCRTEPAMMSCTECSHKELDKMSERELADSIFDNVFVELTIMEERALHANMADAANARQLTEEFNDCLEYNETILGVMKRNFPLSPHIEHIERLIKNHRQYKTAGQATRSNL